MNKSYLISPSYKKSLEEIETFKDNNARFVDVMTIWRGGEYIIHPENEEELETLQLHTKEEGLCVTDFTNWELNSTYDGVETTIYMYGAWTEEDKETYLNRFNEEGYTIFEEDGFEPIEMEINIHSPIDMEEWKGYGTDATF